MALIHRSEALPHVGYVEKAFLDMHQPILVSPDAGAYKTTHQIAEKLNANLVPANKVRIHGQPQISIQGKVDNQDCLIVDDMADGGRTFVYLAKELKKQGANKLGLYVTHAMFHYGLDALKPYIDHVYCTNSYQDISDDFVTQFEVGES